MGKKGDFFVGLSPGFTLFDVMQRLQSVVRQLVLELVGLAALRDVQRQRLVLL